jgi:class 3 adenylate cyclase
MANIDQIRRLNEQYDKKSPIRASTRMFAINESLDQQKIEKALSDSLTDIGPTYSQYFDLGLPANVSLLFIDVCNFSTRFASLKGQQIAEFFDNYYDVVIPLIYQNGGEIDKIIGDGIIAVFGPPFLPDNSSGNIINANNCAKAIIEATKGTDFSSKVAFHSGTINYFKNKSGLYKEFTLVGKPLTELFRLESISIDERVNYYGGTKIRQFYELLIGSNSLSRRATPSEWNHYDHVLPSLKGVNFPRYHSIEYML